MIKGRRVLVIGLDPAVNRRVVRPLQDLGIAAEGYTQPERAAEQFNARDFELIVFGRGVLGPLSEKLKRRFSKQNPGIAFVDAIHPVAVKQTLAALAHDPSRPRFVRDFRVANQTAEARILARCKLTLTIYRAAPDRGVLAEVLASVEAEPGVFEQRIEADHLADANSLLLTANGEEYHLHPFLGGTNSAQPK